jgi:membrane protein
MRTRRYKIILRRIGEIIWYSGRGFLDDGCEHWAAALAFYGILSIFPLTLLAVAIGSLFADPTWATNKAVDLLGHFLPSDDTALREIVGSAFSHRRHSGVISFVVLLWAGTRVFSVLSRALNAAFDLEETFSWSRQFLIQIGMLLSAGLFFSTGLMADFFAAVIANSLHSFPSIESATFALVRWTAPPLLILVGSYCLFQFVPRQRCSWKSALTGAIATALLLMLARWLFLEYLERISNYGQIYGWLAAGIVLIVWAYIVGIVLLFCGELTSQVQLMLVEGRSAAEIMKRQRTRR